MTIFHHSSCKSFYLSCLLFSYLFFNWWHQWVDHRKWSGLKMSHKSTWFELFTSYCKLNDMFTVEYWSSLHVWNALTCVSVPVAHYSLASYSPWQSCNIEELTAFPPALLIALSLSLSLFFSMPLRFFQASSRWWEMSAVSNKQPHHQRWSDQLRLQKRILPHRFRPFGDALHKYVPLPLSFIYMQTLHEVILYNTAKQATVWRTVQV